MGGYSLLFRACGATLPNSGVRCECSQRTGILGHDLQNSDSVCSITDSISHLLRHADPLLPHSQITSHSSRQTPLLRPSSLFNPEPIKPKTSHYKNCNPDYPRIVLDLLGLVAAQIFLRSSVSRTGKESSVRELREWSRSYFW